MNKLMQIVNLEEDDKKAPRIVAYITDIDENGNTTGEVTVFEEDIAMLIFDNVMEGHAVIPISDVGTLLFFKPPKSIHQLFAEAVKEIQGILSDQEGE